MLGLAPEELRILHGLATPQKVQDFLDALPINHEKSGETCFSPRRVLAERKAHCLEGAMLAAVALWLKGHPPLLVNFRTAGDDDDHAVALFKVNGHFGALSKTNHPVLRYRDPVYRTVRELALSYFHEYFMFGTGVKTLRAYSRPVNLRRFGTRWVTSGEDLWHMAHALADAPHFKLVPRANLRHLRDAVPFERTAMDRVEWDAADPRT